MYNGESRFDYLHGDEDYLEEDELDAEELRRRLEEDLE